MEKRLAGQVKVLSAVLAGMIGAAWVAPAMAESSQSSAEAASGTAGSGASQTINLSQMLPALEAYKKYETLLKNPEAMEAYMRLVKAMSQKSE